MPLYLRTIVERASPKEDEKRGQISFEQHHSNQVAQGMTYGRTTAPHPKLASTCGRQSDTDLHSYSDESQDNFVPLKPLESHHSSFGASDTRHSWNEFGKPAASVEFSRTEFATLKPEATLQSDIHHRSSHPVSVPSSSESERLEKSKGSITSVRDYKSSRYVSTDHTDQKTSHLSGPSHLLEPSEVVDGTASLTKETEFPSELPEEKNSTDYSAVCSHLTKENESKSSSSSSRPRKDSTESVSSIPDMAEILERFGVDWAQTMIRRMDEKDEHSSSGS